MENVKSAALDPVSDYLARHWHEFASIWHESVINSSLLLRAFIDSLLDFAFYYPLFMAYLWIIGALIYYYHWGKKRRRQT
jgi:biofilm PGA synthesis N-glycosyltransferase PgaC